MKQRRSLGWFLLVLFCAALVSADEDSDDWRVRWSSLNAERSSLRKLHGLVIAAPHDGSDGYTGLLLKKVVKAYPGIGTVLARGYRSRSLKRYINVNRPTEERYRRRRFDEEESETTRARAVFKKYRESLLEAARAEDRVDLLVELHGNARRVEIGSRSRHLNVIECASTGISTSTLEALDKLYREESEGLDLPKLYFEGLSRHRSYSFGGEDHTFYFRASSAKEHGSLSSKTARAALHFELPVPVRYDPELRNRFVPILVKLIKEAWKRERASTPGILGRLRDGDDD